MNTRWAVLAFVGLVSLGHSAASAQQAQNRAVEDFSLLAGRWLADPPFKELAGPKPRFVNTLVMAVTPSEITLDRGYAPIERYRLDGTPTDLGDNRTTSMVLLNGGVALTTRRVRLASQTFPATIHTDVYRVEGDVLTMDSRRSQTQADGTLVQMESTRVTIAYRRVR